MNTKRTHRTVTRQRAVTAFQQQTLKFEEDVELWQQLPEDRRLEAVHLPQQILVQWQEQNSEGEQS